MIKYSSSIHLECAICFYVFLTLLCVMWDLSSPCGILVPQPGIKPVPPVVGAQSLNHWTTREVPLCVLFGFTICNFKNFFILHEYWNLFFFFYTSKNILMFRINSFFFFLY